MSIPGLGVYKTYLGMSLHFRKGSYNGWDYNFNGKVKSETFEANRGLVHRYAALEAKHPNKNDQLRLFYPAFRKFGFCKNTDIACFTRSYNEFVKEFQLMPLQYEHELKQVAIKVSSIKEFMGLDDQVPFLYNCYIEKLISYDSLLILSLAIPELNTIVSKEAFLWNSLTEKLKFDSGFYNLYFALEETSIKKLKQNTIAILSDAWNLHKR
jgi:hypothetical protein